MKHRGATPTGDGAERVDPTRRRLGKGTAAALIGASVASLAGALPAHGAAAPDGGAHPLKVFDNIAAMVASRIAEPRLALVLGYSQVNDGGGGLFLWDAASTAAPDGGTVFQSGRKPTGRWLRLDL